MPWLQIFDKYQIDYVVHGDDPCLLADGTDVFAAAKKAGRFKTIKRTEGHLVVLAIALPWCPLAALTSPNVRCFVAGVSTTDIVGRMLVMTKEHFKHDAGARPCWASVGLIRGALF